MGSLIEEFESRYWSLGELVVGIDEAGRGPMAGPCMVAAVIFPEGFYDERINDSKKLSVSKRNELKKIIIENALWYQVKTISVNDIDEKNIYRAVQETMMECALNAPANIVLTDAMPLPKIVSKKCEAIIKGDARSLSIAAASILAKTERDSYMRELHNKYPNYGFDKHMGYGTKFHKEAIAKHGRTEHHRKTFRFKDELQISLDI